MKEVRDFIISTLHLTEQDLAETLPSNPKSSVFSGRVGWAKTYLLKAQMIDSPQRGHIFITPSGKALLESGISINNTVLAQKCPEFLDFYRRKNSGSDSITLAPDEVQAEVPETPQETFEVGKKIGENAKPGQIYTLTGDLGVGKTVFTQGVAAGLGITEPICSPTFTIIQEYESGRLPLYHFDVYRIGDIEEMEEIGYDDYFFGQGICLIEWADLIEEILPEKLIKVTIEKALENGFDYRRITVIGPENS